MGQLSSDSTRSHTSLEKDANADNRCDTKNVLTRPGSGGLEIGLLRHGEPVGGRRYRGCGVDDPLSERGWQQMWSRMEQNTGWVRVITSPMSRSRAFAEAYARQFSLPLEVNADLREIGMGAWEGQSPSRIAFSDPEGYAAYYDNPVNGMPAGAEPLDAFYRRVNGVLESLEGDGPILIVAHAGVIRAAVACALEGSLQAMMRINVPYAGLTRLMLDSRGWHLFSHAGG